MELLHKYGISLVFSVIFLEQLGLPIPASPILLLTGALLASGELSTQNVIIFGAIGAFAGDLIWYILGRRKGTSVLRFLCHTSLSPDSCVLKTEKSFKKYGMNSLLFAKFVPGLNTIAPPLAGTFHKSFFAFLWRDLAGIFLYLIAFLGIGFFFERQIFDITNVFEELGRTFFWMILGGIGVWVAIKYINLKLLQRMLYKERITVQELYERMTAGENLTIVDIRKKSGFGEEPRTIPGAIRIPPDEIDQHMHRLDREKWIVMFCT